MRVWLAAQQVVREPPDWVVFAGTAGMVDRADKAGRASQADLVAARTAAMNIPGMMAIVMGTAVAPGMLVAVVERCPCGCPPSYLRVFVRIR